MISLLKKIRGWMSDAAPDAPPKEDVLESFSHDLRKPLNRILATLRYLQDSSLNAEQTSDLARMQSSADQLLNLVNELYDYSRLHRGTLEIDKIPFSLRGALRRMISYLQYEARERNIVFDFDIDAGVPDALIGDPVRLRQILENIGLDIVENIFRLPAGKPFSGSGLRTGIRMEKSSDHDATLRFFFEGDEGFPALAGLQFQVAERLIARMGGSLHKKEQEGHVTGLHFLIPFPIQEAAEPLLSPKLADLKGIRALIVDRYPMDRSLLENSLKSRGVATTLCADNEEALTLIAEARSGGDPFGLIFVDHLQEGSAFRLVERLRECDLVGETILMLMVTDGQRGDAARCRQMGITGYFVKPVLPAEILDAVSLAMAGQSRHKGGSLLLTKHFLDEEDRRLKILYADRDGKKQSEAVRLLEYQGHKVWTTASGPGVLSLFEKEPFDLILMDPGIEEINGMETTRRIREMEKETGGHTPIIGIASSLEKEEGKKCFDAGMDDYISHPVPANQFTNIIRDLGLD